MPTPASSPKIAPIAAVAHNYVIGKDGDLPWHLPADLKWFKAQTLGKPCLMGRRTLESFPAPLRGRRNIALTRQPGYEAPEGVEVAHSLDEALAMAGEAQEVMILGGARVYEELMARADRFYLTVVHADVDGDTRFPPFDLAQWRVASVEHHGADARNAHAYSFYVLEREVYGPVASPEDARLPDALRWTAAP